MDEDRQHGNLGTPAFVAARAVNLPASIADKKTCCCDWPAGLDATTLTGDCLRPARQRDADDRWDALSCHGFDANQVRLQLHVLAYNLGNFLNRLVRL